MYIYIYDYSKRLGEGWDFELFRVEFSRKLDKLEGERGPGF